MKWNSIFVRRVKKTVFRFPFYRISILSRMKLQSFSDFHFRPMSQFPSKCNTLAHENSAGEFPQHTQLFSLTKRTFKTKWTFENMFVFMFCFNHTTQRAVYRLRQTQQDKRRRCSGGECVMDFHFQQNWFWPRQLFHFAEFPFYREWVCKDFGVQISILSNFHFIGKVLSVVSVDIRILDSASSRSQFF